MASWAKICDIISKYAIRDNEIAYQKSIIDLLWEDKLGWKTSQIKEQVSLPLGSTERIIPDVVFTKDSCNRFVLEVKKPSHNKAQRDIDQLVSYMKQLETPVGLYIGRELEVYYKNLGDGSEPKIVLSLSFDPQDDNGDQFVSLFSESEFSIDNVYTFLKENEERILFGTKVNDMVAYLLKPEFQKELQQIISNHFGDENRDVVTAALDKVKIRIRPISDDSTTSGPTVHSHSEGHISIYNTGSRGRKNNGTAQRYAYNLIKGILDKNPNLSFQSLKNIFRHKNYIEKLEDVKDEKRWCMAEADIIHRNDNTKIVISNQWGFFRNSKPKMDRLREIAERHGLDASLPDLIG